MRKFWFELSWPAVAWLVYLAPADVEMLAIGLLGCAIFWTCYFVKRTRYRRFQTKGA